ncbi:hypothetical protein [Bacillus paralicheniformis]|uniref:hypothetical protein n=1 Tax=Bacillus paralicheniformis TaxID=1648923 RepID=UPI0009BF8272|nr:hypothetical protein [Bacillus paralicheniformis]
MIQTSLEQPSCTPCQLVSNYLKEKGIELFYGAGDLEYMHELFRDYVVYCEMYGRDDCTFRVTTKEKARESYSSTTLLYIPSIFKTPVFRNSGFRKRFYLWIGLI